MDADQQIDEILRELEQESKWGKRLSGMRTQLPEPYRDPAKFLAITAEEYLTMCDRRSRASKNRKLLVLEPLEGVHEFDHLLPACFAGKNSDGTSLEFYRFRQDRLNGISALGKVTAHASRFIEASIHAGSDSEGSGIYLSDCRVENTCRLVAEGECKVTGGVYRRLDVKSDQRIEIIETSAEIINLQAPICRIVLIDHTSPYAVAKNSPQGKKSNPSVRCHIKSEKADLLGKFSQITGRTKFLSLELSNLPAWQGTCDQRQVVMSPEQFLAHLYKAHKNMLPSDQIVVSATNILALTNEEISTKVRILCPVDISQRQLPWTIPVDNYLIVSREHKQEIPPDSQRIRLSGNSQELSQEQYQAWRPLTSTKLELDPDEIELF